MLLTVSMSNSSCKDVTANVFRPKKIYTGDPIISLKDSQLCRFKAKISRESVIRLTFLVYLVRMLISKNL